MDLTFENLILLVSNLFGGSLTLAGLAMLIMAWMVCAVICLNLRASPAYSVVPMIPLSIFFSAYGILNETIAIIVVIVSAVLVASQFRQVAN